MSGSAWIRRSLGWRGLRVAALAAACVAVVLTGLGAGASADGGVRPFCSLSTSALTAIESSRHRIGVAVIDLDRGLEWQAGDAGPFALHSVVKLPIAWLALTRLYNGDSESGAATKLRRQIGQMVTHSANEPVEPMLRYIGGLEALGEYYELLGVPEMRTGLHPHRWGIGTASALAVARLYRALAISPVASAEVRREGFQMLARSPDYLRWGARKLPPSLDGWQSLIKTGWFLWRETEMRVNSAAIWLDPEGRPRYVIVMMFSGKTEDSRAQALQNRIGAELAGALAARELYPQTRPWNCLDLPLDRLVARYY